MPKFLYTTIILSIISWSYLFYSFYNIPPNNNFVILRTIFTLATALALTLSFPIYIILKKRAIEFTETKIVYRSALKYAAFLTTLPTAILLLNSFRLNTNLNLFLVIFLWGIASYFLIKRKILKKRY